MCDYRESREGWEWANLAPYAGHSSDPSLSWRRSDNSTEVASPNEPQPWQGQVHFPNMQDSQSHMPVPDLAGAVSRFKTAFQLDKERITSSTAFRRLEYKTQMFVTHEGDHYRTRLTHTIEVNETARFIAQALQLNEDLVDAIALGHDLGHTPFGHAGEDALDELFRSHWPESEKHEAIGGELYGGAFYHNVQSVRVVDSLEKGYEWDRRPIVYDNDLHNPAVARGHGLDLSWAVREGILKHSSRGLRKGSVRMYGSDYLMAELNPFQPATLEGQVVEFADEIASMMHDLEDGLRSRLFTLDDLRNALIPHLKESEQDLKEMLGLSARFIHREPNAPRIQSRVSKLLSLIHEIRNGTDCTVGTVLAVLRSIFLSNIIETSYSRLVYAMAGTTTGIFDPPSAADEADPDDLVWLHFDIQAPRGPLDHSYCSEAWDVKPIQRKVTIQTFRRTDDNVRIVTTPIQEDVQVYWYSRTTNLAESRNIIIRRQDGTVRQYPLGNVCITFGRAKLIGYDNKLLALRQWLRHDFIPNQLHKASMVVRMNDKGQRWLNRLFELYFDRPQIINRRALERFHMWNQAHNKPDQLRAEPAFVLRIVEHLQGMTDRYLTEEYSRLFLHERTVGRQEEITLVDGDRSPFNIQETIRYKAVGDQTEAGP
jgi:predicted deoxyguanosinetriphosphate triphosphohydrolase